VEYSEFGEVQIWVNYGTEPYVVPAPEGDLAGLTNQPTTLPENGFLVLSPRFVAFHATAFGGVKYQPSALFTLRSQDGKPLEEAKQVRVFHGFGDTRVKVCGKALRVAREEVTALGG